MSSSISASKPRAPDGLKGILSAKNSEIILYGRDIVSTLDCDIQRCYVLYVVSCAPLIQGLVLIQGVVQHCTQSGVKRAERNIF